MSRKKKSRPELKEGINYRVINEKVTECTLHGVSMSVVDFLSNMTKSKKLLIDFSAEDYLLSDDYRGYSYCNVAKGEVFDKEKGKALAYERCMELYHKDFDAKIVSFLEELHTIEARMFNSLRKAGRLDVYCEAKDVDEIYDESFIMEGQPSFLEVLMSSDKGFFNWVDQQNVKKDSEN